ncbi:MAG TPA: VOC family protein [Vineibacter sp.]|nr:VOC family protein [Vineibacter sp.]
MKTRQSGSRMIDALDHVVLAVRDLDAAVAAYETLLGRQCVARASAGGATYAWFRLSNMALALATSTGGGPIGERLAAQLDAAGEGLAMMGLRGRRSAAVVRAGTTARSVHVAGATAPHRPLVQDDAARYRNAADPRVSARRAHRSGRAPQRRRTTPTDQPCGDLRARPRRRPQPQS